MLHQLMLLYYCHLSVLCPFPLHLDMMRIFFTFKLNPFDASLMALLPPRKNFIVFSRICDFVLFLFIYSFLFWSVITITLERLNQSEPNFHTSLLTEIARPCTKMGITTHMWPPLIRGFCCPPEILHTFNINQSKPNFHTWLLTGIAHSSSQMDIKGQM